jgi:hypothetical protein
MIGFGGGSIPKSCHRYLPHADIAVIDVKARVIALRNQFQFPLITTGSGGLLRRAAYVSECTDLGQVLISDRFDINRAVIDRIRRSFDGPVLVIQPDDGENMIMSLSRDSDSEKTTRSLGSSIKVMCLLWLAKEAVGSLQLHRITADRRRQPAETELALQTDPDRLPARRL